MDEDSRVIDELRQNNEYQRAQILHLEKSLNQAITTQKEVEISSNNELQKSKEIIDDLNRKLANYMSIIDSKNVELLNLQTALGQYYAEIEAKVKKNLIQFNFVITYSYVPRMSQHAIILLCYNFDLT